MILKKNKLIMLALILISKKTFAYEEFSFHGNINVSINATRSLVDSEKELAKKSTDDNHCAVDFLFCEKNMGFLSSRDTYLGIDGNVEIYNSGIVFYNLELELDQFLNEENNFNSYYTKYKKHSELESNKLSYIRDGLIGIDHIFGQLILGRQQNPGYKKTEHLDLFYGSSIGMGSIVDGEERRSGVLYYKTTDIISIQLEASTMMPNEQSIEKIKKAEKSTDKEESTLFMPFSLALTYGNAKLKKSNKYFSLIFEKGYNYNKESLFDYIPVKNITKNPHEEKETSEGTLEDIYTSNAREAAEGSFHGKDYILRAQGKYRINNIIISAIGQMDVYKDNPANEKLKIHESIDSQYALMLNGRYQMKKIIGKMQAYYSTANGFGGGLGADLKLQINTKFYIDLIYKKYHTNFSWKKDDNNESFFNAEEMTISIGMSHVI